MFHIYIYITFIFEKFEISIIIHILSMINKTITIRFFNEWFCLQYALTISSHKLKLVTYHKFFNCSTVLPSWFLIACWIFFFNWVNWNYDILISILKPELLILDLLHKWPIIPSSTYASIEISIIKLVCVCVLHKSKQNICSLYIAHYNMIISYLDTDNKGSM